MLRMTTLQHIALGAFTALAMAPAYAASVESVVTVTDRFETNLSATAPVGNPFDSRENIFPATSKFFQGNPHYVEFNEIIDTTLDIPSPSAVLPEDATITDVEVIVDFDYSYVLDSQRPSGSSFNYYVLDFYGDFEVFEDLSSVFNTGSIDINNRIEGEEIDADSPIVEGSRAYGFSSTRRDASRFGADADFGPTVPLDIALGFDFLGGGGDWQIQQVDFNVIANVTAKYYYTLDDTHGPGATVPSPTAMAGGMIGFGLLGFRRRRNG